MTDNILTDAYFMREALKEATFAFAKGEIPVGAVVVCNNLIIARAHNMTETLQDITAHAEILAYTSAASYLGAKYLSQCTLYVTLEPCCMCAGALFWAQFERIVFGADDVKRGYSTYNEKMLHPSTKIIKGVLKSECKELLVNFFLDKRG